MARKPMSPKAPGNVLIRDVPAETLAELDAWIKELESQDKHGATYSRSGLALRLIMDGLASRKAQKEGAQ